MASLADLAAVGPPQGQTLADLGDRLLPPPANPLTPMAGHVASALGLPDALAALQGRMTDREAQDFAFGAAMGLLPVGAASRAARTAAKALPMDQASRMARMREMGFFTDLPLAHGTAGPEFRAFDLSRGGATSSAAPARLGVWSEVYPRLGGIAEEFAEMAARKTGAAPRVMPLLHRANKPGVIELNGRELNHEIVATLADSWDQGFDAVMLKNYTSPGGKIGTILVVKDPSQLRSPYAVFDPAKKNSANLLAGIGGAAVVSGPTLGEILADASAD